VNNPIQSLWIGAHLSTLERLSIRSFMDHGHEYHLYTYENLPELPTGTVLKDANEIFPESEVFQYPQRKSFAAFANVFRYKLLLERGGWWADTDVVALRSLNLADEHVFVSEIVEWHDRAGPKTVVGNCLIKAPPGSPAMALALRLSLAKDRSALQWGDTGPRLVAELIESQGLQHFVRPPSDFCPINYAAWRQLIDPQAPLLPAEAYTVHFWNEMWRLAGQDKNAEYPPGCLYERLKRRHLHRTDTGTGAACAGGDESLRDIPG
jgi:hypothetical protein